MIGKTISHYKIIEKIGEGGMGVVYKAEDTKLDRLVALKFLPSHLSQSEEEQKRFIHEAKAASALDHPNICKIYEINETENGEMFIAMAFYEGISLQEKIQNGPLSNDETIDIVSQISQGLAKAHSKGIVHRDIKPANILITEDQQVKIIEFLISKGADINVVATYDGRTALIWAAANSHKAVVLLLANGAKVNVKGVDGMTAIIQSVFGILPGTVTTKVCDLLLAKGNDKIT